MSARDDKPRPPRRGDVQVDLDGSRWIVVGYHGENGPYYSRASRVREDSLAARVIFKTDGRDAA